MISFFIFIKTVVNTFLWINQFCQFLQSNNDEYLNWRVQIDWASIPHFKRLDMRNLQYEKFMIKAQGHVIFGSIFSASDFNSINNGIEDLVFVARLTPLKQTLKSRTWYQLRLVETVGNFVGMHLQLQFEV